MSEGEKVISYTQLGKIKLKSGKTITIDLSGKHNLLKFEHDDFFNYLINEENKICTLDDSLITIDYLNSF